MKNCPDPDLATHVIGSEQDCPKCVCWELGLDVEGLDDESDEPECTCGRDLWVVGYTCDDCGGAA